MASADEREVELAGRLADRINPRPWDAEARDQIKRLLIEFAEVARGKDRDRRDD
jgi:hypothetical protein